MNAKSKLRINGFLVPMNKYIEFARITIIKTVVDANLLGFVARYIHNEYIINVEIIYVIYGNSLLKLA
jgi:hypothetical protein